MIQGSEEYSGKAVFFKPVLKVILIKKLNISVAIHDTHTVCLNHIAHFGSYLFTVIHSLFTIICSI